MKYIIYSLIYFFCFVFHLIYLIIFSIFTIIWNLKINPKSVEDCLDTESFYNPKISLKSRWIDLFYHENFLKSIKNHFK